MIYECHTQIQAPPPKWHSDDDGMEQAVIFQPGFRCVATGPNSHGIHGMEVRFLLRGPKGATQFLFYTDWIPGLKEEMRHQRRHGGGTPWPAHLWPNGVDVGYHAHQPQYDQHPLMSEDCPILEGPCYYDGSGLAGSDLMYEFINGGELAVWPVLRDWYDRIDHNEGPEL